MDKPTKIYNVTVGNRADCCGNKLENLEIRAGMKNDLTNDVIARFKGPGETGAQYGLPVTKVVVAEYMTFQLKKKSTYLMIQGIKINAKYGRFVSSFYFSSISNIIHVLQGSLPFDHSNRVIKCTNSSKKH